MIEKIVRQKALMKMVIRELLEINFMYGPTIPISAYIDFLFIHHNFTMRTHKRMYIKCFNRLFYKKRIFRFRKSFFCTF